MNSAARAQLIKTEYCQLLSKKPAGSSSGQRDKNGQRGKKNGASILILAQFSTINSATNQEGIIIIAKIVRIPHSSQDPLVLDIVHPCPGQLSS